MFAPPGALLDGCDGRGYRSGFRALCTRGGMPWYRLESAPMLICTRTTLSYSET